MWHELNRSTNAPITCLVSYLMWIWVIERYRYSSTTQDLLNMIMYNNMT